MDDLEPALSIIAKLGMLYKKLDRHSQQAVPQHVVNRVVIDATGTIIEMELRPPFTYLHALRNRAGGNSGGAADAGKIKTSSIMAACSTYGSFGTPPPKFIEHLFDTPDVDKLIYFVNAIAYPQRKAVEKFLTRVTEHLA